MLHVGHLIVAVSVVFATFGICCGQAIVNHGDLTQAFETIWTRRYEIAFAVVVIGSAIYTVKKQAP